MAKAITGDPAVLEPLLNRYAQGEDPLTLAKEAGMHDQTMKRLWKRHWPERWDEVLASRRAVRNATQPERTVALFGGPPPPPDDTDVPRIHSTKLVAGWKHHRVAGVDHFTDPEGEEYVRAGSRERADLIRDFSEDCPGLTPLRLRRSATSRKARKARKEAKATKAAVAKVTPAPEPPAPKQAARKAPTKRPRTTKRKRRS